MRSPLPLLVVLASPLVEIAGFVIVGREIGVLPTIALIIVTGIAGSILLRIQGFGVLRRIRSDMEAGRNPGRELGHGLMVLVAGVLLIIPGFFSDILGILLFVPPVRDLVLRRLGRILSPEFRSSTDFRFHRGGRTGGKTIDLDSDDFSSSPDPQRGRIEGE